MDRDPTLGKVQKSSLQACPISLLVAGKPRFSFPLVVSSFIDSVLPSGFLGKDVSSSVGLPYPLLHPHPEAAFYPLSPLGALFPSSFSTPVDTSNQVTSEYY
jgi:hypothetical protein